MSEELIKDLAEEYVGNWRKWEAFAWFDDREDRLGCTIINFRNRDSDLCDESNAQVMIEKLAPFLEKEDGDIEIQRHSHCLVGWVDCFVIRVYRGEDVTEAFKTWAEMHIKLMDYPFLDEDHHSNLQCEKEWEYFEQQFKDVRRQFDQDVPDDAIEGAYEYVRNNHEDQLEDTDGHGAWVNDDVMEEAIRSLGYTITE